MTPDELRSTGYILSKGPCWWSELPAKLLAAAVAWDLERVARHAIEEKYNALRLRLEAAVRIGSEEEDAMCECGHSADTHNADCCGGPHAEEGCSISADGVVVAAMLAALAGEEKP